jgi:creatinine amidohydrolase
MKAVLIGLLTWTICAPAPFPGEQPRPRRTTPAPSVSRIHRLDEMAWPAIDALDRRRSIVILPLGMLEQHGPHLPIGADTIGVAYEAGEAAKRVGHALPGWHIVMMPPVNYGHGGANQLGGRPVHPGTYGLRQSTLRSLVADLGGELAQNRFTWIFVLNGHGAPAQNIAINQACDFVSETFGVTMLHVSALFRADAAHQARGAHIQARYFSPEAIASFGMDVHAGVGETSGMLALRPELVGSSYRTLPSRAGRSLEELRDIATASDWRGYLSSPALATAAYGRALEEWWIEGSTDLILRALRGEDLRAHPRFPEAVPPVVAAILERAHAQDAAYEERLTDWLAREHQP